MNKYLEEYVECERRVKIMVIKEIKYKEMECLFAGIEDGWIIPNKYELELYYAHTKWVEEGKEY